MTKIELNRNSLSGTLPEELGDLSNLQKLRLQSNSLSGTIPSELGELGNLQDLGLYNNSLSGTLPSWIVSISDLQFLGLSKNDFHGTVPSEYSELGNLRQLGLAQNSLSGTLPSEYGELGNLQHLYLHENSLGGTLPSEYGELDNLRNLWLHGNSLSGTLPESIKDLSANKRLENHPYMETPILDYEVVPGESLEFDISGHFSDINDNIASYSAEGLPEGLTIDSSSGAIGGIPTTEGSFLVTVTASDDAGNVVSDEFNIDVRSTPDEAASDEVLNASDYAALLALYHGMNGENWQTKWDISSSTPPKASVVSDWHGVTVEEGRVTKIELIENSLSGTLPSELGNLSNLQVLNLN
ncbi:MAG: putative Ig domain-containing protein, partial [Hormoscilla sp. GUM202]|nr:putative Ig domain-containing protein [Hormoscilla sp. GUM202]